MQKHHTGLLARRLIILFMLVATLVSLSTDRPVQKVKAYSTCAEQCQIEFENCWLTAPSPGAQQRCYEKSLDCIDQCPE
jgi:hypothetical protein